ncbi:MAG: 4'-phosphopantetheinyl transferase family protein [Tangfeifania sp.]
MPFLKKITIPSGTVGIWKLSETSSELLSMVQLFESEKSVFQTIKNEKRKKEYLAVRALLKKMTGAGFKITYEKSGCPKLLNYPVNISISHSAELAVIFLSEKNAGIDVENTSRDIAQVAKRFLSETEMAHTEKSPDKQTMQIIYWGAKEAIFKCTCEENIRFNNQIRILPFELNNEGNFRGELTISDRQFRFDLGYFKVENNVVVYCVEM